MGISIENLCVTYGGGTRVIDGMTLDIAPGSFFTLLGPSGCGKTTLLRTIAGFVPIASGSLRFSGKDVTKLAAHERNIGMVFQDYALFPNRTVFENVAYGLRARKMDGASIRKKVPAALERVGLGPYADRLPAALSGGQRQRVALARAMVIQPQVLLMDEPLSNLDAKLRVQVRETIAELQQEAGITTVFVTHDQEEALALSDQIAVMNQGRVEQLGSPQQIYREPATAYVADFIGAANLIPVQGRSTGPGAAEVVLDQHALRARAPHAVDGAAILVARPEDIGLARSGEGGLPGRIRSQQYLGVKTTYRIEFGGGRMVNVDVHGDRREEFDAGMEVSLAFDPLKTRVLAS
ncbi:ABC transporter ATP-binding protein [Achromobacter denitrificans]|uniref:ABC transporter ATP-binding protein n=1 Tax=Achromobacter denitrificans TaxID=32002 RepID=UPI0016685171|nr:ABC transporter ATP-binding protein [Achromobacter denitrificans]GFN28304.1 ABC transporter ATP-binding protein [Achromobacter denitrificans]